MAAEARGGLAGKLAHLGTGAPAPERIDEAAPDKDAVSIRLLVRNAHGLHARPAARFVQTAAAFDARVQVRDVTNGRGPADAGSLNGVAMLGVGKGHEIEVTASGPQAAEALEALRALAERDFDETAEAEPPEPEPPEPGREIVTAPEGSLHGYPASPGVAIGPARRFHVPEMEIPVEEATDPGAEGRALERAVAATREDVARQRELVAARAGEAQAQIFDAHLLFLRDEALLDPARRAIRERGARPRAPGTTRSRVPRPPGTPWRTTTCGPARPTCAAWAPRCSRTSWAGRCPGPCWRPPACWSRWT